MQNISVYLNKRASNANDSYWKQNISSCLFRSNLNFRSPKNIAELNKHLQQDIKNKIDAIISVGGDGTVNTLIQSLANKGIALLVVPGGTANDLASELGLNRSIKKICECIRNKQIKEIDLINVNGRLMATNGGIGLGGEVAKKINGIRKKFPLFKTLMKYSGKSIYSFYIVKELLTLEFKRHELEIISKNFNKTVSTACILINNQALLAGTFNIAPETSNSDGRFNISILSHSTRAGLIKCIVRIASGKTPENDPDFISFETNSLQVNNLSKNKKLDFFGDGEILHSSNLDSISIQIEEKALKVYSADIGTGLVDLVNEVSLN